MVSKLIFILFPAFIHARIQVEVVASEDESSRVAKAMGNIFDVISDRERSTFHLNDEPLKQAVEIYFGKRPTDVYVKSPTLHGDLYQTYNWAEVIRTLTPQNAKILSITSQPTTVSTHDYANNSSVKGEYHAGVSQAVENTVSTSWERNGEITLGQEIEYEVVLETTVGGKTSFQFTSAWGESCTKSETVTVGSESGVTITLEPGQKVVAELYATRGTMKIQVDYEASLSGVVAVNYEEPYKGHHFWSLDVNGVLRAAGLPTRIQSTEVIDVGYYADSKVVIRDATTMSVLRSIPILQ